MDMPEVIYCGAGSKRYSLIAVQNGMRYGARLPGTVNQKPLYFADQDWRRPTRERYMAALAEHRPHMATVLDWEREAQLPEVLDWAEEAAAYADVVMLIPKVHGRIDALPRSVGGAQVRLGYSVPSKHGASALMLTEFYGWPVHLLGGTPNRQMEIARYLDVRSVDGNAYQKAATMFCKVWTERGWKSIAELDGVKWGKDAPYEAFRRSCVNIMAAWRWQSGRGGLRR